MSSTSATCDYCGLPVVGEETHEAQYCCYGCRFAAGVTAASGNSAQARWLMTRLGLSVFFTMNVMVFTLVLWSAQETAGESGGEAASLAWHGVARYLCLLFSSPVMLMLAGPLVEDAWHELRAARPSLNLLLAGGVVTAFLYSAASTLRGSGHVYFEVSCVVLVFVTLGRWFEASGKLRTTAALRELESLLPEQIRVVADGGVVLLPRGQVEPGMTVRVFAGERIPVDGQVTRNRATVDQQAVTGESVPVVKEPGDDVFAGSLNVDGDLWIAATSRADAGLIARLIESVTQAITDREPYQRLAARVSRRFVPIVGAIALATFAWHAWYSSWEAAVLASLSVVVIACPCALGLATPMALWAALGRAAQARILVQEGDALSRLAAADAIFFDKTGTLSTGHARLRRLDVDPASDALQVERMAVALAASSTHPLARALVEGLQGDDLCSHRSGAHSDSNCLAIETLAGRGLRGVPSELGEPAWLGSRRLLDESGQSTRELSELLPTDDGTAPRTWLGWGGRARAVATFDEEFRPHAAETLAWFQDQGWRTEVLTGDGRARGERLAANWRATVRSELLPDDKLAAIEEARSAGRRVVMVGDGLNDAPALAAADVGVSLACGTDVSRQTAAVCLLGNDLRQLPWLVALARQTDATVRWNLFWAFGYNVLGIGIAAVGWLNPIIAAVAMVVSSLLVVSNSLRLAHLPLDGATPESNATIASLAEAAGADRAAQVSRDMAEASG